MRFLRPILRHAFRITSTICLLIVPAVLLLTSGTSSKPLRIKHTYQAPGPQWADGEFRVDIARGGFWILHLQTRAKASPNHVRLPDPLTWNIDHPDTDWIERISTSQTGPMVLGFCTHLRRVERSQPLSAHLPRSRHIPYLNFLSPSPPLDLGPDESISLIDPHTGLLREEAVVEEERITRIPIAGLLLVLFIPSIIRVAVFARGRRLMKPAIGEPSILVIARQHLFSISAVLCTSILIFGIWQWVRTQSVGTTCKLTPVYIPYVDRFNHPSPPPLQTSLMLNHEGWHLTRDTHVPVPDQAIETPEFGHLSIDTQDTALAKQTPIASPRLLGFVLSREVTLTSSVRSTHSSLLVPHWAFVFLFAISPAIWLFQRLRPNQRAHRLRNYLCLNCGYDLRASPDRCPECGTIPDRIAR